MEPYIKRELMTAILGVAVGDALGVPVEFKSRKYLEQNPVTDMLGTSLRSAGTYSDDTAMTLCTLASLQENHWKLNPHDIMTKFLQWGDHGYMAVDGDVFDMGITTRKALNRFRNGLPLEQCGATSFYECGNGSLMRIMPIVFYLREQCFEIDKYEIVKQVSALTHAHDVCTIGCYIYVMLCYEMLNVGPCDPVDKKSLFKDKLPEIYKELSRRVDKKWLDLYARIFDVENFINLPVDEIKSDGYIVNSLEAALWCFLNTDDYRTCVLKAVNLGSDSDTTAAIAGGIAGIYYDSGWKKGIPEEWLDKLRNKELITKLCGICVMTKREQLEYDVKHSTGIENEFAVRLLDEYLTQDLVLQKTDDYYEYFGECFPTFGFSSEQIIKHIDDCIAKKERMKLRDDVIY